jgi:LacI family transcriptional regulator
MNLRELAELLNLSQTTVSRALNGYPEVSETTRKRVAEAARLHHYQPNARAKSLATGRSMCIGHVIPPVMHNQVGNVGFAEFIAGAGDVYRDKGYDMLVSIVPDDAEMQAYRNLVGRQSVEGFIVHAPLIDDPRISLLNELNLPFVVHGRSSKVECEYTWLDVNNRRAIERATAYLHELGHDRIALVNGEETMDFAWRRRSGYLSALEAAGIAPDPDLMTSADMTEPEGFDAARRMLGLPCPPTAFVCASIVSTLGVRRAVEARGLRVGTDVSIVCFDDAIAALPNGGPAAPTYTATRSSIRKAGRRCAEILIDRIENPGQPHVQELWEAELLLGQSTAVNRTQKTA